MTVVNKISDFKLERYLLGELSAEEMKALQQREAEDEIFAARVRMMREEGKRFLAENPFSAVEDKLENAERPNRSFNTLWLKVAATLVIALGVFSAVVLNRNVEITGSSAAGSTTGFSMNKGLSSVSETDLPDCGS